VHLHQDVPVVRAQRYTRSYLSPPVAHLLSVCTDSQSFFMSGRVLQHKAAHHNVRCAKHSNLKAWKMAGWMKILTWRLKISIEELAVEDSGEYGLREENILTEDRLAVRAESVRRRLEFSERLDNDLVTLSSPRAGLVNRAISAEIE